MLDGRPSFVPLGQIAVTHSCFPFLCVSCWVGRPVLRGGGSCGVVGRLVQHMLCTISSFCRIIAEQVSQER